jgi:hypothetical protein
LKFPFSFGRRPSWQIRVPAGGGDEQEILVREHLRIYRASLRKNFRGSESAVDAERHARHLSRQSLKRIRTRRIPITEKAVLTAKFRPSAILDELFPDRKRIWQPILRRIRNSPNARVSLEQFSFLHDPAKTLESLREIGSLESREIRATLDFNDERCIDIGAFLVLSEFWPAMAPIYNGGRMAPSVQKVLRAVGLHRPLSMSLRHTGSNSDVWAFPLQRRRPAGSSRSVRQHLEPQKRERVADGLVAAINEWVGQPPMDMELTDEGRAWISNIAGELLDNAERHSHRGGDGDWSITAFMERTESECGDRFLCHLAFLSVGDTISDSLSSAAPHITAALDQYTRRHAGTGLATETLRTIFALQDGVTRDPAAASERRGGTGFQEVFDLVHTLGGTAKAGLEARIAILSGRACILMRHPYIKGEKRGGEDSPRELWFNGTNDHRIAPDPSFVFDLPYRLAGTLITMAFTLDPEYLNSATDSDEDCDD